MSKAQPITVRYNGLEILCNPDTVFRYRQGKFGRDKVLVTDNQIYKDVKKGSIAGEADIVKAFGEKLDLNDALEEILQKGDYQTTTKERQEMTEQRRLQLIDYFHSNFTDATSQTGAPHSHQRIATAFKDAKVKVNYEVAFSKNVSDAYKSLLGTLPLKPNNPGVSNPQQQTQPKTTNSGYSNTNSAMKTKYGRKKGGKSQHYN